MVAMRIFEETLCTSNVAIRFLHLSLNLEYLLTSYVPMELLWAPQRTQEPHCQPSLVRTEEVWSKDHCMSLNHKALVTITYVKLTSVSIIKRFLCEI